MSLNSEALFNPNCAPPNPEHYLSLELTPVMITMDYGNENIYQKYDEKKVNRSSSPVVITIDDDEELPVEEVIEYAYPVQDCNEEVFCPSSPMGVALYDGDTELPVEELIEYVNSNADEEEEIVENIEYENEESEANRCIHFDEMYNEEEIRCATPPLDAWEARWVQHIQHLGYTDQFIALERDAESLEPANLMETCFTVTRGADAFDIIQPFGNNPLCVTLIYPVEEKMLNYLYDMLPSWVSDRIYDLTTLERFQEFAHFFAYHGSGYRMSLLARRAVNEGIKKPAMHRRLEEEIDENKDDLSMDETPVRQGRFRTFRTGADPIAAAAIDGRTPVAPCRRPMRQRVLFRDGEEGDGEEVVRPIVKRRKLELDD